MNQSKLPEINEIKYVYACACVAWKWRGGAQVSWSAFQLVY